MAEAKRGRYSLGDGDGGKACSNSHVAQLEMVVNAKHEFELKPNVPVKPRGPRSPQDMPMFKANVSHRFSIRTAKTEHSFRLTTDTDILFKPEDYASRAIRGMVTICTLEGTLSFASATVSLHRQGEMVACLKSRTINPGIMKRRDPRSVSAHLFFESIGNNFRPVPDQAITFKVELKDLLVPKKLAADEDKMEMCKLLSCKDIESRLVSDVATYMLGDDDDDNNIAYGNQHCDLKLVCQGEAIPCHKFMLSARSPVLKMILSGESKEAQTGTIEIEDSSPSDLKQFVKFLYSEEIKKDLDVDSLANLLHLAEKYDVDTLTKVCCQELQSKMNRDNASDILRLARMYKLDLEEAAKQYVADQAKDIIKTDSWNELLLSDPTVVNEIIMKILK